MSELSEPQKFFIHAGLPKTGTSFLQDVLFGSREALRSQGLALIPHRRGGHFDLTLQLRGMLQPLDRPQMRGALDRFTAQVARNQAPSALLTQEALAPATPAVVSTLMSVLEGYEVHLVLTVRDLGRQVPSAWQQAVKGRRTTPYGEFLEAVVARGEAAADFWRNQDLAEVLRRWGTAVPAERTHVITCPPSGAAPGLLLDRFCSVLGLDPVGLDTSAPTANASLGHPQAELLRRVNLGLGDRFAHSRAGYRRVGRSFLSDKVLLPQGGERARLPDRLRPWVEEVTRSWVGELSSGGYDVVGDLAELDAADSAYVPELTTSSESELLEVAVTALADILELRDRELEERARERSEQAAVPLPREAAPGPRPEGLPRRLRRRAGALRRRLR